jgi:general stress protein YciG
MRDGLDLDSGRRARGRDFINEPDAKNMASNDGASKKSRRGFASMDAERRRQVASMGGKAAHACGTAHEFTTEEAREAGRKGGETVHAKGVAHKFTREEARIAGRKGGIARQRQARRKKGK